MVFILFGASLLMNWLRQQHTHKQAHTRFMEPHLYKWSQHLQNVWMTTLGGRYDNVSSHKFLCLYSVYVFTIKVQQYNYDVSIDKTLELCFECIAIPKGFYFVHFTT